MPHIASCLHASFNPWTQTNGFLFNLGSQSCGDGGIKSWLQGDFFGRWRRGRSSIVSFLSSKLLYWIGKLLWGRWRGRKHRYSRQHTFIGGEKNIYSWNNFHVGDAAPNLVQSCVPKEAKTQKCLLCRMHFKGGKTTEVDGWGLESYLGQSIYSTAFLIRSTM